MLDLFDDDTANHPPGLYVQVRLGCPPRSRVVDGVVGTVVSGKPTEATELAVYNLEHLL